MARRRRGGRGARSAGAAAAAPGVERGRQAASAESPDGSSKALPYRDQPLPPHHDRRQREGPHQVRHGELGLRRGAGADDRDVVVADSTKLAYYRFDEKQGPRLLPAARTRRRFRARSTSRRIRRPAPPNPVVDLFVYDVATKNDDEDRRPRRQAVRQRGRRPLRLPRVVVAGRPRAAVQPHEPPPEHPRVRRGQPRDRRDARDRARGVADRLGRQPAGDAVPEGRHSASSGSRSATAGTTSTSTISPASCSRRSPRTRRSRSATIVRSTKGRRASSTRRATATTT